MFRNYALLASVCVSFLCVEFSSRFYETRAVRNRLNEQKVNSCEAQPQPHVSGRIYRLLDRSALALRTTDTNKCAPHRSLLGRTILFAAGSSKRMRSLLQVLWGPTLTPFPQKTSLQKQKMLLYLAGNPVTVTFLGTDYSLLIAVQQGMCNKLLLSAGVFGGASRELAPSWP